ncbi:MAG: hypothetical protein PVI86_10260 [Phycisphaerae bacterium]|jgi:DNA-binding NtrC family response regulator
MPTAREILIVEPEDLVRWSLVTYLRQWFQVHPADSKAAVDQILEEFPIDALVLSDDMTYETADEIEQLVRSRYPSARVVRMVTDAPPDQHLNQGTLRLEKPFELSQLGGLLGANNA